MEGYLNKLGEKKALVPNLWRKRWFQLVPSEHKLYYWKDKDKSEAMGHIDLREGNQFGVNKSKRQH